MRFWHRELLYFVYVQNMLIIRITINATTDRFVKVPSQFNGKYRGDTTVRFLLPQLLLPPKEALRAFSLYSSTGDNIISE